MSRATEIALALLILQGSIAFVDAVGMFEDTYIAPIQNNASGYNITYLSAADESNEPSWLNKGEAIVGSIADTFLIGFKIMWGIVFIYPVLEDKLHVPAALSAFLQIGIYFVYIVWLSQYRSNKGWTQYE